MKNYLILLNLQNSPITHNKIIFSRGRSQSNFFIFASSLLLTAHTRLHNNWIPPDGRQLARDDRSISRGKRAKIRIQRDIRRRLLSILGRLSTPRCVSSTRFPSLSRRGNTAICTVASLRRSRSRQTNRDSI